MTEVALAVVLLIGAGLMTKSLVRLLQVDVGFNPKNVLTMAISLPSAKYSDPTRRINFQEQLSERVTSLQGVESAGIINILPLTGGNTTRFYVDGDPVPAPGQEMEANHRVASSDYFQTLGIPLVRGRYFDGQDKRDSLGVVIISKTVADRVFAGRDPIGQKIKYTGLNTEFDVIVGVVGDVKITGLDEAIRPVLYYAYQQASVMTGNLVVRTSVDPSSLINAVRNECRLLEPDIAVFNASTFEETLSSTPAAFMRRFPAFLIGIFAMIALILATIGIYGVVSYSVSQQTHDIGVRMALGARSQDIIKMVIKQGLTLTALGLTTGVLGGVALTRLLSALLFEVRPSDPMILLSVAGLLVFIALFACYIPARRATKVEPIVALRYE